MSDSTWAPDRPGGRRRWIDDDQAADEQGGLLGFLRPDEGWISLGLVLVLCLVVGWSIADARWVLGRDDLTSFLIWMAGAAALWGYFSARLQMSPWLAHLLGAAIGAFVIIECVGSTIPGAQPGLVGWFMAAAVVLLLLYVLVDVIGRRLRRDAAGAAKVP